MPRIQQLDLLVADLIAAGEVVERTPTGLLIRRGPHFLTRIGRSEFSRFQGFFCKKRLFAGLPAGRPLHRCEGGSICLLSDN